jgi:hypothetical protein
MAYEIDLPDGSRGRIHDDVPRAKALEVAKRAYPDAFPPPPTALDQALSAPKNIAMGAGSGIVSAIGGLGALPYTGLRYLNPEMTPFAETGFGKKITETEQSLAPTDEGYGSQLSHGLGSFLSVFGPQAIARGFGTAGRLSTGLAPKAATPIAVAQTSGLGAEEARNRVEAARAEGKTVTPGEEFGALAAGVPAGLTELLPVQSLFKATKGLDTGLTKGLQTAGFEGVKNFGKRALQQAGIEAAQEAGSGAIQDVIAQQIYNPEQEIGGSALKEAALGGGVGAIAQLGLDLALRKDIKMAYQMSQKKKSDEDLAKQMEEVKAETAKKRAETDAALGISPLLALPAPKEQMTPSQAKHPIYNPLGNFSEGDLDPANILAINAKRAEENKPKLKSFSIEDLADSGMSQADISGLVAKKTGYAGTEADTANIPQHINDVLSLAADKNVDPSSQGFKDFLRRATGLDDLQGMSAPQLFSAYTAVYRLPDSTTPQELHPGTSATRFSEGQYDTTIKNLNAAHPEDNALTLDDTISQIKEHSGLKNDTDAESLMHTAIRRGDLFAKSYPAPDGTTSISVHVPNANKEAGPDIRKSSVESGIQPESYVIKSSAGVIEDHPTQDAADARVAALTVARQAQADRSLKAAAALSKETDKAQTDLDAMAARGESNTLAFQQKASEVAAKTQANQAKAETLSNTAASLVEPLVVEPKGQQITAKDVHTVYEGNQPIAAFDTAEKAQAHALSRMPEEELQKYTGKLGVIAQNELAQRQRKEPGISIIQTGGKEKAEEVLLSAGIFTGRFKQKAEELDRQLRPLMSRLGLGDLRLNIAHAIESGGADGKYAQKIISIALDAKNPIRVLRHEGIHALKELGFFTKEQWRILENKAKSEWVKKYNIPERYADLNIDEQLEEAIADAFSDFDQTKPPAGLIGVLFGKLKTFMEALSNAIEGLGFDTHSSIFGRVSSGGEMAPIKPVITERVSVGRKREPVADAPEAPPEAPEVKPVAKPVVKEAVKPAVKPVVKTAVKPAVKPVVKEEKPTVNKSVKMKKLAKARKIISSADTMNEAIIKMGGINVSLRPDLTGDKKGNQKLPFVGSLFSKNGTTDLSDLALNLGQYGYFTPEETESVDGGARLLADRLREEFDGGSPHQSMENMDDAADAALNKRQEEERELFEAAQAAAKKKGEEFYGAVSPDVLDVLGIPVTPEVLVNGELLARAIAISPEKVDDIATQYEGFVEGFNAAIAKFIKEQRNGGIQTDDGSEIFGDSEAGGTQVQGKKAKFSRRQTETPAFKQWFGKSKAVNADGTPKIYYHGTARDIGTFEPKQSKAIFLTEDPRFAESFADASADWVSNHSSQLLNPKDYAELRAIMGKIKEDNPVHYSDKLDQAAKEFVLDKLNSGENIMPLYARAENPFDYENPRHVAAVMGQMSYTTHYPELPPLSQLKGELASGTWIILENEAIQDAIKAAGFDSFYVKETGRKNLAVYSPNQVKSAVGNTGAFSRSNDDVRYSRKVDRLKATGSSKAWIFFSEANKGINFTNIKTLAEAGEAAEEHYKDQIKNIPEFDGKAYMEGLTIGDINAYPPDIQHAIQEYKAGNESKGIQEILDTVASQRKANIKEWKQYIENINPAMEKDPFWRDYVISSLLKSMRTDKPDTGLPLNANALGQLYEKFKQGENINFAKGYQSALVDATKDLVELGDATTGWRKIPQTDRNNPKFDERVAAVQSLSCTGWCTRSTMAAPYIQKGDFWVYVDDKKPQVAIRFEGDEVQEIQGPQNDRSIPTKYIKEITSLVDSGKIKNMTGQTKADITKAVRKSQFEAMIKEKVASGELVEKNRGYARKNGIDLDERYSAAQGPKVYVDADGGIVVNDDVVINANEAAPNLKAVGGNADIHGSAPALETIEGDGYIYEGGSVPALTTIGGGAYIHGANVPSLTTVDGGIRIYGGSSLPKLTTVNGDVSIFEGGSASALETVGRDAWIREDGSALALTTVGGDLNIEGSAPALETVGGSAYIRKEASIPALTTIGGDAYVNQGANAPALTTVGGNVQAAEGASLPALATIGEMSFLHPSIETPNLRRRAIGKEAALKGTALGKDQGKFSRRAGYAPSAMQGAAQPMSALDEAVNRTTTVRKTAGLAQRIAEAISPTSFTRARQAFINKYEAIENLTRDVAKRFGDAESFADVSAIAAALFSDRAAGVAASSFMNGIPKYQNGFTKVSDEVRGLIPILEPLMKPGYPQNILQLFQFYAGTRRGSRLLYEQKMDANGNLVSTSREYNFTKEDIALGNSLERQYPEFKTVFAEYQQYNNGLVQFMKDTGVISAKEAELWTKNWDYIPFYRQMDGERISAPSIFSSIAGVTKPKELKGGEAPLADFLETVVRNARAAIEAGMKNVAGQRVVRDIVKIGQGQEVPAGTAGLDIVTVKQEGVTKYYKVNDPLLVESLRGLNLPNLPFVDILAAPANFLRSMVTKDPGYMMANMMRDSMQAWVTSGANITPILDTFKQYGKVISGQSPEAKALSDAGLFSGYDFSGDTKSSAKEVEKELRKRTGKRTILQTALLPGAKVWEMLDKGSHASDVATRAEIYKRTMESTGGNEAEALYQALEIMNFSRKGNSALIRIITALVPFMNARIQGIDVLYRTGFGKSATANREAQQKAFITRSMTIFSLSVMYWMLASDTEEYKTATQEERDNNWIFGGAKIPIPFELGVMFKVFPERILENFFGTDTGTDLKKSIFRNLTSTLVMNPIPHAFVPIVEHIADYSFFTGQEVVGKGMEGLATRYQAQPGTSLLAKTVGKETGASPVVLDNYIRGYTGTIGTYIVMAIDAMMHGEGDDIKASKRLEQMPVFRRFMSNKLGSGTVNAYYDLKKEVETSTRTINYLERQGRMDDMAEYLKGRGGKLQTIKPYIQELEKDMDGLRDFRRDVRIAKIPADRLAEIEDAIRVSEINLTRNIQTIKKAIE